MLDRYENETLLVKNILREYSNLRNVTAIRLLTDIHNLDDEENVRWSQNIRFEIDNFENLEELKKSMTEYIKSNTAPI